MLRLDFPVKPAHHCPQAISVYDLPLLLGLLRRRCIKGVQERQSLNPGKVFHIAGHERQPVDQCGSSYEGITEGHLPLLAETYRLIEDGLRERQDPCEAKERFQILPLLVIELVIPEHFHVTDGRDGWRMRGNELPQVGVRRLGRIDEDIAIDEHHPSHPGKTRSWRSSRCHLTGSEIVENV
jgi:hypothetical protein